ncbi:MAG: hypothetical protein NTZ32_14500 [Planctomycetales bacterium]|nr:hypothetical protein [Planctomycetales bacterium]
MANSDPKTTAPPPKFGLFEFVIGGVFCVGFPGFMTAIAPVSWMEFTRVAERVDATTQTCVFFVFPYSTQELADVKKVSTTFQLGDNLHRRAGDRNQGRAESEGGVILHGPEQEGQEAKTISVSVSPASFKVVEAKVNGFLGDPQQKTLKVFVVANWKFGIIFAAPLCLLTVLYVVSWSMWLGQTLAKPFMFAPPEETNAVADETHSSK